MKITLSVPKSLTINLPPAKLADHWSAEDHRRDVDGDDEDHEKKVREAILRSFIMDACNEGLRQAAAVCEDIPDVNFVDCSSAHAEETWQQFILDDQDGKEHVSYTITLTQNDPEEW